MIKIRFENKIANTVGKPFILNSNIYKKPNGAIILGPNNLNPERKADVDPEGMPVKNRNKQEPNNQQHEKITSMISMQSLTIQKKTGFAQLQSTYTT